MRTWWQNALASLTLGVSTVGGHAQIVAVVDQTTFQAASGVLTVPLGFVSANKDVYIFDSTPDVITGMPNESVERIIIDGAAPVGTSHRVRILIAKANTAFPVLPSQLIDAGIVNIGRVPWVMNSNLRPCRGSPA